MAGPVPTFEQWRQARYGGQVPDTRSPARIAAAVQPQPNYASGVANLLPRIFAGTGAAVGTGAAANAVGNTDWARNIYSSIFGSPASSSASAASSATPVLNSMVSGASGAGQVAANATPFTWVNGVPTQVGATGAEAVGGLGSYLPSLTTASQIAGGLGGAYAAYNAIKDRGSWDDKNEWEAGARHGAGIGAGIGTALMPGIGTLAGGAGGAMWGALASQFGGGKHKDQRGRDQFRKDMKDRGMLTDGYNLNLADGGKYDIGLDGSHKNYNVDFSRSGIGDVVGSVNPLAYIIAGGDEKKATDLAGYYTNAASSSGDANANALKFYKDAGIDRNQAWETIDRMVQDGKIDANKGDAFKAGIDKLHGVK